MANMKNLKIKTGVCKWLMKELQSYQSEADKECIKAKNMRRSHADPFDIKQQQNYLMREREREENVTRKDWILKNNCSEGLVLGTCCGGVELDNIQL
uniref:Tubulin-specific chaperone A n=1 Tax=Physcomitrium patens TaxID=3218 RepID=A0A2K1JRS9_PHYPA|nr:hypothetical protein PHYPA_016621 [Physcomitrium patens]